jgi:rhodanese-related sulfurtransferase
MMLLPVVPSNHIAAHASDGRVAADEVHARLDSEEEWALVDVREQGAFDQGHVFWACNAPLSHLESIMPELVPRRQTPLVLMDEADDGLARRASQRLAQWGYTDITILEGGLQAWRAAGLPVHAGIHVPSKAFGEFVEHHQGTPSIEAEQLKVWADQGHDMLLVDCRPFDEFSQSSLPGSINCPGMELVTRVPGLVNSPDTVVVVHCAGRTRGIVGAQTLINAKVLPSVVTLKNGMAGWLLNGGQLSKDNTQVAPAPTARALEQAQQSAAKLSHDARLPIIDLQQLSELRQDRNRTLYIFDVRTPQEYQNGHLLGARLAPGGQLIQTFDAFVGTRGSRIVLCDDNGVRARLTGYWLKQMGWTDILVLEDASVAEHWVVDSDTSAVPVWPSLPTTQPPTLEAAELHQKMTLGEVVILDFSDSLKFGRSHIPGAWFAVRARLDEALAKIPPHQMLVLTSDDGSFATMAWAEAQSLSAVPVAVLQGGNQAWQMAGGSMASGRDRLTTTNDDVWYSPLERPDPVAAIHEYLRWEIGLNDHLERERGVRFQRLNGD